MKRTKWLLIALLMGSVVLTPQFWHLSRAAAQAPVRQSTIIVPYTQGEWWMIVWEDNSILCRILTDHDGLPTSEEVGRDCGPDYAAYWENTPPCQPLPDVPSTTADCEGVYLHLVATQPMQREVVVELPPPVAWVNLGDCTPAPPDNLCPIIPTLLITGEEPLPDQVITSVEGNIDGEPFYCEAATCALPLRTTGLKGATVEFWVNSSYGDQSEHFSAQIRVLDSGVSAAPGGGGYYVDVISSRWQGRPLASCARLWESFPPVGGLPLWLTTPDTSLPMTSDEPYYYLAGRLISQELVNASDCPSGGLLPNGYADTCGLERARPLVQEWQNLFDGRILLVAQETGVPAQLLKNLFAQESQFWPGVFRVPFEYGLGQITHNGADTILLWNDDFFHQFCPLMLSPEACEGGYLSLDAETQAILRGALALQAESDCQDCQTGVDLKHVNFSISLFANTLQASCAQVNQTIHNAANPEDRDPPAVGTLASYEDLWRFTVGNYHAGSGCMAFAIYAAQGAGERLTWDNVASHLTPACRGVIPYVDKITGDPLPQSQYLGAPPPTIP